ncbi:MAG: CoA transferase [Methylobacteriaceae bacterium]|nr:CoA transferase [Methylobacteriaceae bacterium]
MDPTKPLRGIRVLELCGYISGPYATSILAALGAEVVKVEPPKGGDAFRRNADISSFYFVQYNAGKKSIAVDLKRPEGVALVRKLAPQFDVVIENNRPGKMASLGLGPDEIRRLNPSAVYMSVSGFGDGGPWRDRAAYDSIGQSMGGIYSIMNDPDDARLSGTCIGDLTTALMACMGILAGLVGRSLDAKKEGLEIRTSILEAMSAITIDAVTQYSESGVTPTRESRHPQGNNFCLKTADGEAITIHLSSSEKFWTSFTQAMRRPDLASDARFARYRDRMTHYFELQPIVMAEFLKETRAEWERRLIEHDVPFAPVMTVAALMTDPQTQWLDMMEPTTGGNPLVRPPWRFSGVRPDRNFAAPHLGEHTREIAASVLSQLEIDQLVASGVIAQFGGGEARAKTEMSLVGE